VCPGRGSGGWYFGKSITKICRNATTFFVMYCGSENKQRLFPYTALTDWFL
jgi:hypothetical protein